MTWTQTFSHFVRVDSDAPEPTFWLAEPWTSGIIWTPCFSILFFQAYNTGPVCVTLKPFMVEGHAVSHFKALVIFYQEPEDQDCCSFFSICNTRLKMGVFTVF